jgi:hypothetical protein
MNTLGRVPSNRNAPSGPTTSTGVPSAHCANACLKGVSVILHVTEIRSASDGLEEREKVRTAPQGSSTPGRDRRIAWFDRYWKGTSAVEKSNVITVGDSRRFPISGSEYRWGRGTLGGGALDGSTPLRTEGPL